jgi:hypothetical protein
LKPKEGAKVAGAGVANVGMVKPEIAGAPDKSAVTAGAAPKPPKGDPLLVWAVVEAAAGAAPPKEDPSVVAGALDDDVDAAGAGALKVEHVVDPALPPPVKVDDAGAALPMLVVVPPPAPPPPPSRGTSQDAHAFNVSLL